LRIHASRHQTAQGVDALRQPNASSIILRRHRLTA
jgi:hypothetical protein